MSIKKDMQYLTAAIPDLENYLLSRELYYPIGMNLPQLTLGGVLLAIARAGAQAEKFEAQAHAVRSKWKTAWDAKTSRELRARRELWRDYLSGYRSDPKAGARLYPQNVHYRAMLTLLGDLQIESDEFVRSVFVPGKFAWEENSAQNFERNKFWYLFGTLK